MRQALSIVQLLTLYAGLLLLGQGLVFMMSLGKHEENAVYRFFRFLTSPVVNLVRRITPNKVSDRHVPVVAFLLLFWVFFGLAVLIPMVGGK
jgi:uncharacterized protein YggT (Ycf19 family)